MWFVFPIRGNGVGSGAFCGADAAVAALAVALPGVGALARRGIDDEHEQEHWQGAQHVFRRANRWSAHGKMVLPRLRHVDPGLAARYEAAFANAFGAGRIAPLLELCGEILAADGYLFNGYRVVSDATWRTPIPAESAGVAVTAVPIGARRE